LVEDTGITGGADESPAVFSFLRQLDVGTDSRTYSAEARKQVWDKKEGPFREEGDFLFYPLEGRLIEAEQKGFQNPTRNVAR